MKPPFYPTLEAWKSFPWTALSRQLVTRLVALDELLKVTSPLQNSPEEIEILEEAMGDCMHLLLEFVARVGLHEQKGAHYISFDYVAKDSGSKSKRKGKSKKMTLPVGVKLNDPNLN